MGKAKPAPPGDAHEWLSFEDPNERRTWVFDVTFLASPWSCLFGRGCQGVLTEATPELSQGCCSYGAHLVDEDDALRVGEAAERLRGDQWQLASRARARGGPLRRTPSGQVVTRIVDGACAFLNRPGFPGGPGCALHRAALEAGVHPLELKPDVCWQLPLRREDEAAKDGHVTSTVRQWDRRHWGAGGADFHWWCTEAPEAFAGRKPVVEALAAELTALVGDTPYRLLRSYMDRRGAKQLSHPVLRRGAKRLS